MTASLPELSAPDFAMSAYEELERQTLDFMDSVPFVRANQGVVSPRLIPILMEACSLVDSILRHHVDEERASLKDLAAANARLGLSETASVLLVSPLQILRPFRGWTTSPPEWWLAYNKVKHDRLRNFDAATYPVAVSALVALHQVITRTRMFSNHLVKREWVNPRDEHLPELLTMDYVGSGPPDMAIETKLVVSPLAGDFLEEREGRWTFLTDFVSFSDRVLNFIHQYEEGY